MNAQQWFAVLSSLRSDSGGRSKRIRPRVGLNYRVNIIPCAYDDNGQKATTAWLRDISTGGISITAKLHLNRHQYFLLIIPRTGMSGLNLLCRVEMAVSLGEAGTRFGARFIGFHDSKAPDGKKLRRFQARILAEAA